MRELQIAGPGTPLRITGLNADKASSLACLETPQQYIADKS